MCVWGGGGGGGGREGGASFIKEERENFWGNKEYCPNILDMYLWEDPQCIYPQNTNHPVGA